MKTKLSGVSAGNIHINKLASLAKINFLSKLFYILFILLGMQSAYSDSLSFDFLYTTGIESVYFDQTNMGDRYTVKGKFTVTPSSISNGYRLTVNTGINSAGSSMVTNEFNKNSPRLQVGGSESSAFNLDFWFSGVLVINGHRLGSDQTFIIAHENHKSSNADWWIADISGNASLYGSENSLAMTVGDDDGNYYCLSQNGTNYQIVVSSGTCNQNPIYPDNWNNSKNKKFRFVYESGIESMSFIYDGISDDIHHNEEYLESVTPSIYGNGYEVTVTSKLDADTETATSFIDKYNPNNPESYMLQMNSGDKLSTPDKLNFWVEGSLYINNELVASDFTLAYDEHGKWWIGSTDGISNLHEIPEMQLDGYCFIIKQGGGDASSDDDWSVLVTTATSGTCPTISPNHGFSPPV